MLCVKCKMRYVEENFAPLCYICGLKSKGFYRAAIKALTDMYTGEIGGWWGYHTNWNFKEGWSFFANMCFVGMMLAVLKSKNLNKTPKTDRMLSDYFSKYWIDKLIGGD